MSYLKICFMLEFQDFDRAMVNGLKAAQSQRKQGGGDVERHVVMQPSQGGGDVDRRVVMQPSQVRISDYCNLYLTSYCRSEIIMTVGRVGKVRLLSREASRLLKYRYSGTWGNR